MKNFILFSILIASVFLLFGCKGSISIDETYNAIRPVKQLELPDQIDDNFVVVIKNVADEGSSYKNRVDLYINDHKINPDWLVSNVQNTYVYKMRVRPGYYKIKAYYYAYIGWGEDKYEIVSDELIRVQHDKRTVVSVNIVKKPNGEPVNKKMYFKTHLEDFDATPARRQSRLEPKYTRPGKTAPPIGNTIALQINTAPEHAEIIIDDKVVGESPLRYDVDRTVDHIIQISANGYKTKTKFLDRSKFGNKQVYHVIQELEEK